MFRAQTTTTAACLDLRLPTQPNPGIYRKLGTMVGFIRSAAAPLHSFETHPTRWALLRGPVRVENQIPGVCQA